MACRYFLGDKELKGDALTSYMKNLPHEEKLKVAPEIAKDSYQRLSWTPGEAQAARYDLSKSIDKVTYDKNGTIAAYDKRSGERVIEKKASEKELADIVGKEVAEKLVSMKPDVNGNKILNNADLKIGGEGMKGFYDKMIPQALEKIGKEHGVKVKKSSINKMSEDDLYKKYEAEGHDAGEVERLVAKALVSKGGGNQSIHYIDIPQSLKDHAMHKGFPLFSAGGHMLIPVNHNPFESDK